MEGIKKKYPEWKIGTVKNHQIEFRLDIEHREATFSLRLTNVTFRYPKRQRQFSRASLIPTVAHAMVWLSDPQPTDIFVELCCGSGTILSERLVYPADHIIGGDISSVMTMAAKQILLILMFRLGIGMQGKCLLVRDMSIKLLRTCRLEGRFHPMRI